MNKIDEYLARLRRRVKQPCNLALLDYRSSCPERRLQDVTMATFCTKQRLASLARLRTHKPVFGRDVPLQTRLTKASQTFSRVCHTNKRKKQKNNLFYS